MLSATDCTGRSPHGERGLKCQHDWGLMCRRGRSPHGERGLKCAESSVISQFQGRSPHGERGLKSWKIFLWACGAVVALPMESVD